MQPDPPPSAETIPGPNRAVEPPRIRGLKNKQRGRVQVRRRAGELKAVNPRHLRLLLGSTAKLKRRRENFSSPAEPIFTGTGWGGGDLCRTFPELLTGFTTRSFICQRRIYPVKSHLEMKHGSRTQRARLLAPLGKKLLFELKAGRLVLDALTPPSPSA